MTEKKRFGPAAKPLAERFWSKVNKDGPIAPNMETRCWIWTGAKTSKGYGATHADDGSHRFLYAHRAVHDLAGAPVAKGVCVLHRCDTPACVRPDHHFFGTRADNNADRDAKGRAGDTRHHNHACGSASGSAKLTEAKVADVLLRIARGERVYEIAYVHDVSWATVDHIRSGRTWRHVAQEAA